MRVITSSVQWSSRPEHTIEAVAQRLELWSLKPIEAITGIIEIQTQAEEATASIWPLGAGQDKGAWKPQPSA